MIYIERDEPVCGVIRQREKRVEIKEKRKGKCEGKQYVNTKREKV
jgi:hypothetical protein